MNLVDLKNAVEKIDSSINMETGVYGEYVVFKNNIGNIFSVSSDKQNNICTDFSEFDKHDDKLALFDLAVEFSKTDLSKRCVFNYRVDYSDDKTSGFLTDKQMNAFAKEFSCIEDI